MENTFHFQVPFSKIDKEQRIVVGIATADNIDKVGDIVDYGASLEAFANWVGNIREMHAPKAVGKAVAYKPLAIQGTDGEVYHGIQVEAYVSKGAEDTWQKVLDGTLTGFSIGGMVEKMQEEYHTKLQKMVRRIVKYALGELSLVDNPCNPAAQISVIKNHNGTLLYEMDDEEIEKAETYVAPDGVRAEARRALGWIADGEAGSGFTDVGRRRASQLANGDGVSIDTIKKMSSYLARHAVDKQGEGWSPGEPGYPSPGRVAWAAWGGDPAIPWTNKILRGADNMSKDHVQDIDQTFEKTNLYDIYFCKDCGIATYQTDECNVCQNDMISIGLTNKFDDKSVINAIDNFMKGGATMEDLQKNEIDDNITDMNPIDDSVTVSTAAIDLVSKIASSVVPHFILNAPGLTAATSDNVNELTKADTTVETTEESGDLTTDVVEKSNSGGEEVNTDELLKGFADLMDGKLNEFKEQIIATVDEKIETVSKSVEEESETDESLEKSDGVEDEKDALIKSLLERVDSLESKGAMKKSLDGDSDVSEEEVINKGTNSVWNGYFLPTEIVKALGYES